MNKRGDIASVFFIVVLLFIIGVVFVMTNNLNHRLLVKMEVVMNDSNTMNDSVAIERAEQIKQKDDSVWDYAFLGLFIGSLIALGMTAYATRFSIVFFWIYVILGIIVLVVGTMLSNFWQAMAENPEMTETIARFPITNTILGSYYPLVVTGILMFIMGLLFAKTPENLEGGY